MSSKYTLLSKEIQGHCEKEYMALIGFLKKHFFTSEEILYFVNNLIFPNRLTPKEISEGAFILGKFKGRIAISKKEVVAALFSRPNTENQNIIFFLKDDT